MAAIPVGEIAVTVGGVLIAFHSSTVYTSMDPVSELYRIIPRTPVDGRSDVSPTGMIIDPVPTTSKSDRGSVVAPTVTLCVENTLLPTSLHASAADCTS